jgi:phage host-nuclease inhibitor protein Gam
LLGGGDKKSRRLLHGSVAWRDSAKGLEVVDEAALLAWAKAQPAELELVRTKESPDLRNIGAYAKQKKLTPPGMQEKKVVEHLTIEATGTSLVRRTNGTGKD